jgi:Zn-dependent M16 (insulinase) family peptidase
LDVASIPRLSLDEVKKEAHEIMTTVHDGVFGSDIVMIENEVPESNGIAYVDFAIDISNMDFNDVIFIPLLSRLMAEAGTDRKSDIELQQHIDEFTGGLTIEPIVEEVLEFQADHGYKVDSGKHMVTKLVVRTSCFSEKGCAELFNLIKSVLFESKINKRDKVINILQKIMDDMEDDLQENGQDYTTRRIVARYSLPGFIREQWFGITQLYKTRAILADATDDTKWQALETRLLMTYDAIKRSHHSGLHLSITGDHQSIMDLSGAIEMFVKDMISDAVQKDPFPDFSVEPHPWVVMGNQLMNTNMEAEDPYTAFIAATLANDVGKGGLLYEVGEHISGADMAVTQYLGGFYLNEKIRFNLGASQAWAELDMDSGVLIYQSEETPSIHDTLEIYESAAAWVQKQMSGSDSVPVEAQAAIVGAVGKMDGTALQANHVGFVALMQYLKHDTKEGRQKWRDEALGATKEDFMFFVNRLAAWGNPSITAITSQRLMDIANVEIKAFNFTTCGIGGFSCP